MPRRYYSYILRELVEAFVIALAAYTFVLTLGGMFKPLQAGLGVLFVVKVLPCGLPSTLPWTVPVSMLTASVIAYGRLSSDNEILAMNSLGVHPAHVVAPAMILAAAVTLPLLYCNHFIEPRSHEMRKGAIKEAALTRPFSLLTLDEPCFEIKGSGVRIYIGEAFENKLKNVMIFRDKDRVFVRDEHGRIRSSTGEIHVTYAERGEYEILGKGADRELRLRLFDVEFKYVNRAQPYGVSNLQCDTTTEWISLKDEAFVPGWKDMTTPELMAEIDRFTGPDAEPIRKEKLNDLLTRVRLRWARAFDVLSLALLGVPLGVLTRRGRKLVGFGVSVLVVVVLYFPLVVAGKAMSKNDVLGMGFLWPWGSVVVITVLGLLLLRRQIKV